jgi:hypothetical protein
MTHRVTSAATEQLLASLASYGNVLSAELEFGLTALLTRMTEMATGRFTGRRGWGLPCGGGKTQAAVAWSWAAWKLRAPWSVLIASSRIDNLMEIREELLKLGTDPEAIGLLHSDPSREIQPTEDNDRRQIMLVTHARVQRGSDALHQYMNFEGRPRELVIYDESLVLADSWSVSTNQLVKCTGAMTSELKTFDVSDAYRSAAGYLEEIQRTILEEIEKQDDESDPARLAFPELPIGFTARQLADAVPAEFQYELAQMFENAGGYARAVKIQGRQGCVWFEPTLPEELQDIMVLDASLVVRLLPALNGNILGPNVAVEPFLIDYGDVTLHTLPIGSGRGAVAGGLQDHGRPCARSREIAQVINAHLPPDEAINIWTFKPRGRGPDPVSSLRTALERQGVDFNATVETRDGTRARINIITWGNETATSRYAYAPHTIFHGVLHPDTLDVVSKVIAANDDLRSSKHLDRLQEITAGEVCHFIYQAASRSSIRYHNNGHASRGTIWLPIKTAMVLPMVERLAFPGIKRAPWPTVTQDWTGRQTASGAGAREISAFLEGLPADVDKISSREIRPQVGDMTDNVYRAAINMLKAHPPAGWSPEGRSWLRA